MGTSQVEKVAPTVQIATNVAIVRVLGCRLRVGMQTLTLVDRTN